MIEREKGGRKKQSDREREKGGRKKQSDRERERRGERHLVVEGERKRGKKKRKVTMLRCRTCYVVDEVVSVAAGHCVLCCLRHHP